MEQRTLPNTSTIAQKHRSLKPLVDNKKCKTSHIIQKKNFKKAKVIPFNVKRKLTLKPKQNPAESSNKPNATFRKKFLWITKANKSTVLKKTMQHLTASRYPLNRLCSSYAINCTPTWQWSCFRPVKITNMLLVYGRHRWWLYLTWFPSSSHIMNYG